jgi:hypothetical protein
LPSGTSQNNFNYAKKGLLQMREPGTGSAGRQIEIIDFGDPSPSMRYRPGVNF